MVTKNDDPVSARPRYKHSSKLLIIAISIVLFLAGILLALPYALHLAPVRNQIASQIGSVIDGRFEVKSISWSWLPSPHLLVDGVEVSNAWIDARLAAGSVRLDLPALLRGKADGIIELLDPDIKIKTLEINGSDTQKTPAAGKKKSFAPSALSVVVKNGHVRIPSDGFLKNLAGHEPPLEIFDMDATVSITPVGVDIQSVCRLTFIEKLNANVRFEKQKAPGIDDEKTYWNLDINGETVNLTEAVEKVMLLFGTNPTAKLVCGIVRGGRAKSGGYAFQGYTEDFNKLGNMRITAVPESAIIRVPGVDLHLVNASGPIKIEDAVLTGENLSATLGNSFGKNCHLALGLGGENPAFSLALDLDADISELPLLLKENLIKNNPSVRDELDRIKNATGRAKAKLTIGDTLDEMVVKVVVSSSDSRVGYQRFQHPVGIKKGTLEFYPDRVSWRGVNGTIGPHVINDTKGTVFWKGGVRLGVEKVDAVIQSRVLFNELVAWPAIQKELRPLVRSIGGPVDVIGFKLEGPVANVQDLVYDLTLKSSKLNIDTPLLPGAATIADASVHVGTQKVIVSAANVVLGNQQLKIKADLAHDSWKRFRGSIEVQGNVEEDLARWIKEKGWVPAQYFPRVPCRLEPMRIGFNPAGATVKGNLITPLADRKEINTTIDLELTEDNLALNKLVIASPEEKASMRIRFDRSPESRLDFGFSGRVKRDTISLILEENQLLSGNISGDFNLTHFSKKPSADRFNGNIEMNGFTIQAGSNRMGVNTAEIIGHGSSATFKNTSLALNDEVILADGRVAVSETGIATDLNVRSNYLSVGNLKGIYHAFIMRKPNEERSSEKQNQSRSAPPEASPDIAVTGNIDFDCSQFEYSPETSRQPSGKGKFVWDNLAGKITLQPEGKTTVTVSNGSICGIETTGVLTQSPEHLSINISKGKEEKADVKSFLACIGMEDKYLSGQFGLDAKISGVPGRWKNGHISLQAEDGTLKDLSTLSRILTLINVTELFSMDKVRSIFSKGYPYSRLKATCEISDNRLVFNEAFIIGDGLDFFIKGGLDLGSKDLDLIVYAKPFKTIDAVVTVIPFVGKDLGDGESGVALIPIKVKGKMGDPDVSFYRGDHKESDKRYLRNILKRTFALPSKMVDAITPDASVND